MDREKIFSLVEDAFFKRKVLKTDFTDVFRVFNSAGDGIDGLIIDRYGQYLLVQLFRDGLSPDASVYTDAAHAAAKAVGFPAEGVLLKNRFKKDLVDPQSEYLSQVAAGSAPPQEYCVLQNGMRIEVDLVSGMNTGLFLDMRAVRERLEIFYREIKPVSLLNLFCYTGAFSVHAQMHGVARSINVDTSRTVLRRAMKNFELNNLRYDTRDFSSMDAGEYLRYAKKKNISFDMVIFDPPTFSRSKTAQFSVMRDYSEYLKLIHDVAVGGYVLSVINTHSISDDEYMSYHPRSWENIFFFHEPDDFPEAGDFYLKAGLWKIC